MIIQQNDKCGIKCMICQGRTEDNVLEMVLKVTSGQVNFSHNIDTEYILYVLEGKLTKLENSVK